MAKLFLSYAREDAAVSERLARGLERTGRHEVWWDRDLLGGASFGTEIEQQLRDCDAVIVIWSASSAQSPWVRDEAAIGREAGKLIPVTLGDVDPPIGFRQFHTIDIGPKGRASGAAIDKIERAVDHRVRSPERQRRGRRPPQFGLPTVRAGGLRSAWGCCSLLQSSLARCFGEVGARAI